MELPGGPQKTKNSVCVQNNEGEFLVNIAPLTKGANMATKASTRSMPDAWALARTAGLHKAAKQFPDDVAVAVQTAAQARSAMPALDDVAAEPWPPMRMRGAP